MQKNIYSTLVISLLLFSICSAQVVICKKGNCLKGDVGYFSFSIGPSIPLANFASKDVNNKNAGFAKTGSKVEINGGYNIFRSTDLILKLFYSSNNFDAANITKKLNSDNPGTIWTTSGRSWDIVGGLIGLNYSYPFKNKFVSDFKFQSGIMKSSTPRMVFTASNGSSISEDGKSASSFVFLLSAGGHYPLGRLIDITGNLEYLSSNPTFNNINKITSNPENITTSTSISSYKQNISLLSFNVGCRVKF